MFIALALAVFIVYSQQSPVPVVSVLAGPVYENEKISNFQILSDDDMETAASGIYFYPLFRARQRLARRNSREAEEYGDNARSYIRRPYYIY